MALGDVSEIAEIAVEPRDGADAERCARIAQRGSSRTLCGRISKTLTTASGAEERSDEALSRSIARGGCPSVGVLYAGLREGRVLKAGEGEVAAGAIIKASPKSGT